MAKTRRRKKRTHVEDVPDPSKKPDPRTFVFRRGKHANLMADLEMDIRKMMMPNTALNLRESKRNMLRDFVSVAGPLGVTHFIMLTATESSNYMRVAKSPRGPTLALRIKGYSLARDVQSAQARPRAPPNAFQTPPLVVLNGFGGSAGAPQPEHLKLATVLLQAMFPPLNVNKVKLSACHRVVLLTHDKNTGMISLRHYSISVAPSGIRKSLKALLQHKALPKMGEFQDVSEFVMKSGYGSESEGEDAEASRVTLAQDLGHGNAAGRTSRVRLHEIGPRMELEMVKIEEGLCEGRVLYHSHIAKTPEEAAALQKHHESKNAIRAQRRQQQEANVKRKRLEAARKEAEKAAEAMRKSGKLPQNQKKQWWEEELEAAEQASSGGSEGEEEEGGGGETAGGKGTRKRARPARDDEDDDQQYFREEVGHDPEETDMIGRDGSNRGRGRRGGRGFSRGRSSMSNHTSTGADLGPRDSNSRMGGASRTSTVVLGLVLLLGLAQAKSLPKFSDIFGREPAGSIGLTIEFESEQKATAFENAGPVFTTATNALLTLITKKIPGDLVSVKLHTTGGSEPDGTNVNLFISIELPGLVSNLEATKIIQDNMQDQLTELAASIPSAAKTTLGIVNITGLEIGAEVPSYSFTFSATLGLQEAVEDLNFDEDKLRKMTQGLSQLLALVGGHIDLLRPASKAVVVDGTNVTINGLFTLEGFSNLPPAAVDAIKKFANEHANDAIQTIVEEFGDSFRGVEVLDVKLGFGETPEIEEAATSENIVVTIELDNAEMATALKDQQANINLLMILLEQVVAPPGTIIALADTDPLSVDGNKVMVKLKSRILGAATSAEADELIKDFIKKIDTELIPAYIEQLNEFVGKGSNLGFSTMSIKLSDAVAEEIATEENEDANTQDSEVVFTLTPEVEIDDDVINKWNAKDGSGNATLDNFVSDFETKLTQEVKDGCLTDNVAGNCNSAEVKVIGLKPVSSRRQLLATKIQVTSRVNNAPKSTVESVSKGSGLGTFDGFNAAAQASLSLGMLAAALLIAFIQM